MGLIQRWRGERIPHGLSYCTPWSDGIYNIHKFLTNTQCARPRRVHWKYTAELYVCVCVVVFMPHAADTTGAHDVLMRTQTKGPRVHLSSAAAAAAQHRHRPQSLSSSSAHTQTISRPSAQHAAIVCECMHTHTGLHHMRSFFDTHTHTLRQSRA